MLNKSGGHGTLLAEVYLVASQFAGLFMAVFTATVFFPGDNEEKKKTEVVIIIIKDSHEKTSKLRGDEIKHLCKAWYVHG